MGSFLIKSLANNVLQPYYVLVANEEARNNFIFCVRLEHKDK